MLNCLWAIFVLKIKEVNDTYDTQTLSLVRLFENKLNKQLVGWMSFENCIHVTVPALGRGGS